MKKKIRMLHWGFMGLLCLVLAAVLVLPQTTGVAAEIGDPQCAVTSPVNNANIAPPGPVAINGTSSDDVSVAGLTVRIFNVSSGLYWNGSAWAANLSLSDAPAATAADGTFNGLSEDWYYTTLPAWVTGSSYKVQAQVTDGTNTAISSEVLFGIGVTPSATANPNAPVLGEAGRFVILAYSAVTTTGVTAISNGDIGITPAARTFMTGFTPVGSEGAFAELTNGLSYAPADANPSPFPYPLHYSTPVVGAPWTTTGAMLTQALGDLNIAYTYLAADPNQGAPTQVCPTELGGLTLTRGVYKTAENVIIEQGDLTLDAQGDPDSVWIFSISGTLTTGTVAIKGNVILANGAQAKNVYWRTGGITVIGPATTFYGSVFSQTQINVLDGARITGSLFAVTEQVTLIGDTVTKAPPSVGAEITAYSFPEQTGAAVIGDGTIDIEVASGTDVTGLIATFTLSDSASAKVGIVDQVSAVTTNDFTAPVVYVVTAEDGTSTKDWTVTVTVVAPATNAPSDLTATAVSSSQINLTWTDNSNDEAGFKIERKTGADGTYRRIAVVRAADVTSYSDTRLKADTEYYYQVMSYSANTRNSQVRLYSAAAGDSDYCAEANDTTFPPPPPVPVLISPANRARWVNQTPQLTWNPSDGAVTYDIQLSTARNFDTTLIDQAGVVDSFFDVSVALDWNTEYYWRVNAVGASGSTSAWSRADSFTTALGPPPAVPSDLTATAVSSSQIDLTWTDNSDDEAGFKIERKTGADGTYVQIGIVGAGVEAYSSTRLAANTEYYYQVRAYSAAGNSGYCAEANDTTLPPPPPAPVLISPANRAKGVDQTPQLTWNPSDGAVTYNIQLSTARHFDTTLIDQTGVVDSFFDVSVALDWNTEYYWRVNAVEAFGSISDWSRANSFKTGAAPAVANPTAPDLGEAGRFVILASQKVTTTGTTAIRNGDIGIEDQARSYYEGFTAGANPGQFTQLVHGLSYAHDDTDPALIPAGYASTIAFIDQVRTDLGNANDWLLADPNQTAPTQVCKAELGGLTLTRGVYKTDVDVTIQTGDLTLDAQGDRNSVWIFSIDGTLTTGAPGGNIVLANGAQARNIYWRTAGVTTIGPGTIFYGNVFAWTQVNVLAGAGITGRLFALTDQVTLIADTVTKAP